jgi:hypothetical protein
MIIEQKFLFYADSIANSNFVVTTLKKRYDSSTFSKLFENYCRDSVWHFCRISQTISGENAGIIVSTL